MAAGDASEGRRLAPVPSEDRTYAAAGVSLATAEAVVGRLRAAVESTGATGFGAFAGLYPLDERRLLAASMDSIGTKPIVARQRGALRACGADMAAHCINDVITTGAEPLFLLDYVAANRIDLEQVAELVEGAAEVCRAAGVALVGGETAELPDVYRDDELDFAATCVGIVERDRLIDGSAVREGDVVVGFPRPASTRTASPSRGACSSWRTTTAPTCWRRHGSTSTTCAPARRRARVRARDRRRDRGESAPRPARGARCAEIDWDAWERPPVFDWLARHVDEEELRRVFNLGIGYCAVLAGARRGARHRHDRAAVIGVLVSGEGTNLQALLDAGLPVVAVASNARRRSRTRARRGCRCSSRRLPPRRLRRPRRT